MPQGKGRSPVLSPKELVEKLVPLAQGNAVGLAFGSEKEGLTNEELSLCHLYVRIPSADTFPSLNLAQSVMVVCYELFNASNAVTVPPSRVAPAGDLERMFEHMEKTLIDIGFLNPKQPKSMMRSAAEPLREEPHGRKGGSNPAGDLEPGGLAHEKEKAVMILL